MSANGMCLDPAFDDVVSLFFLFHPAILLPTLRPSLLRVVLTVRGDQGSGMEWTCQRLYLFSFPSSPLLLVPVPVPVPVSHRALCLRPVPQHSLLIFAACASYFVFRTLLSLSCLSLSDLYFSFFSFIPFVALHRGRFSFFLLPSIFLGCVLNDVDCTTVR